MACRLNIDRLAALVQHGLGPGTFAACDDVFSNRRRTRVQVLGWARIESWLLLERLEADRFI